MKTIKQTWFKDESNNKFYNGAELTHNQMKTIKQA